jgi:hypothetical protein
MAANERQWPPMCGNGCQCAAMAANVRQWPPMCGNDRQCAAMAANESAMAANFVFLFRTHLS